MTTEEEIRAADGAETQALIEAARPSVDEIDELAKQYQEVKADKVAATDKFDDVEKHLIELVRVWGSVPAGAEKSRRLNDRLAELTVTKADSITVNFERVADLKAALEANGHGAFFHELFAVQTKYEIVDGAEAALKKVALPRRLADKVMNLFGRCITVKAKKPSLKVTIADPAKPAKKGGE